MVKRLESKVSGHFESFMLICFYISITPQATGVTQHPVTDDLCDDEDWIDKIIADNFCLSSSGDINLMDDKQLICDSLHVPLEEEKMIRRKAKPCSPDIAGPPGDKSTCKKRKVQPPMSPKKKICKEGGKIRVRKTGSGKPCIAEKATPAFVEAHVAVPKCKEVRLLIKTTSESPTIAENPASANINRAIASCGGVWKIYNNINNPCSHEGRLYLWGVPSLGRLCRVETTERIDFQIQKCPTDVIQLMNAIIKASAARNVDASKIPECSIYQVNNQQLLKYTCCFFAGTFYFWRPPLNVCKRTDSRPRKWDYCTAEAVRVMQMVGGTGGFDVEEDKSNDVTKTFMTCAKDLLRKKYSSEDDRCVFEGWLFLWQEQRNVLCLIHERKDRAKKSAACSKGAVDYIERIKDISRTPIDATLIPVCFDYIIKIGRSLGYKSCFFKGLYLEVIEKNGGDVCSRRNGGKDLPVHQRQYCFEDELNIIKAVVSAGTLDRAGPTSDVQRYDVSMDVKKRQTPADDDEAIHPESERFRQNMWGMVNASCPPGVFLGMQDYEITPSKEPSKQKRSMGKLNKRDTELLPSANISPLLAKTRQNRQLADRYQVSFTVLVRKGVAEEDAFNQVDLLENLKKNSRTFDGGAYIVERNSIEVHKVSGEPNDRVLWKATWIVGGVTCAALVLLSIIIISCSGRSRAGTPRTSGHKNRQMMFSPVA